MVHSSPGIIARLMIWVMCNERTNCSRTCSYKLTNRLQYMHMHGKGAEPGVLAEITALQLHNTSSTRGGSRGTGAPPFKNFCNMKISLRDVK